MGVYEYSNRRNRADVDGWTNWNICDDSTSVCFGRVCRDIKRDNIRLGRARSNSILKPYRGVFFSFRRRGGWRRRSGPSCTHANVARARDDRLAVRTRSHRIPVRGFCQHPILVQIARAHQLLICPGAARTHECRDLSPVEYVVVVRVHQCRKTRQQRIASHAPARLHQLHLG